ncbi:hypothetical protein KAR91_38415 [Candidatus Pacearchaeota archaeon]|nr:hypothetical protein [Candidatus Pacearchaeota archaeon]
MGAEILLHYYKTSMWACAPSQNNNLFSNFSVLAQKILLLKSESRNIIIILVLIILQSNSKIAVDVEIYCSIIIG